ncbi:MAG: 2,3,4,5-tetrahydropyridine-2,6-dicarboxylate N-acetyltransferase [Anaeroplasmataceae bacterium]|nr:2,3,4,5-tetrahydropyridine-2,6-dicarboxylate N-acetyltransferase [Anaeroplasmataceae bacterium]MDE6414657.1 2,3,4,5-tetrahydropyridine-2,6-dicarboxylate N-acetyltransferase [Anaeroplasmataceae bacterium]
MNAEEIISLIHSSPKKTPVKCYLKSKVELDFNEFEINFFGMPNLYILFGEYSSIKEFIKKNKEFIIDAVFEGDTHNSAIPLLDIRKCNARIEPGAIIRDMVEIHDHAVIMMGAILNIGAVVGENTMIDMGAVLGGRATVGKNCHIGAGAVLAGVVEPLSSQPVVVEDDVLIGANAVVIEGVRVGKGAVVAAGSVVIADVAPNTVVGGVPAKFLKVKDEKTITKTALIESLRSL